MNLNYAINYDLSNSRYVSEVLDGRSEFNGCYGWGNTPEESFTVMKIAVNVRKQRLEMELS